MRILPRSSQVIITFTPLIVCFIFSTLTALSQEEDEFRKFTSSDGKAIEAKAVSLSADTIKIEMKNGRTFELPVTRLSLEDQQWIGEWDEKRAKAFVPSLKISFDENMDESTDETGFVYVQKLSPELEITNEEAAFDLTDAKVTTFIIVENVKDRDDFIVLSKQTTPLSLTAGEAKELKVKEAETMYATIKESGGKYAGHALIIENASGTVIAHKGSRGWGKNPENALKAQEGSTVQKDFKAP